MRIRSTVSDNIPLSLPDDVTVWLGTINPHTLTINATGGTPEEAAEKFEAAKNAIAAAMTHPEGNPDE